MPLKVQVAPPAELMDVMLDLSSDRILASIRSEAGWSRMEKRRGTGGEKGKVVGRRRRGTRRRVGEARKGRRVDDLQT